MTVSATPSSRQSTASDQICAVPLRQPRPHAGHSNSTATTGFARRKLFKGSEYPCHQPQTRPPASDTPRAIETKVRAANGSSQSHA